MLYFLVVLKFLLVSITLSARTSKSALVIEVVILSVDLSKLDLSDHLVIYFERSTKRKGHLFYSRVRAHK